MRHQRHVWVLYLPGLVDDLHVDVDSTTGLAEPCEARGVPPEVDCQRIITNTTIIKTVMTVLWTG